MINLMTLYLLRGKELNELQADNYNHVPSKQANWNQKRDTV